VGRPEALGRHQHTQHHKGDDVTDREIDETELAAALTGRKITGVTYARWTLTITVEDGTTILIEDQHPNGHGLDFYVKETT
jgi:hypothetical protein